MNEISFSHKRKGTKTRFEKEAKSDWKMADLHAMSLESVLPTSRVIHCAGKPTERVVYCFYEMTMENVCQREENYCIFVIKLPVFKFMR